MESLDVADICEIGTKEAQVHGPPISKPVPSMKFKVTTSFELSTPKVEKSSCITDIENPLDPVEADSSPGKAAGFTFIQVENKRGPRTKARSHVMREFWREKRLRKINKIGNVRTKEPCSLRPKILKRKAVQDDGYSGSNSGNHEGAEYSAFEASGSKSAQPKAQGLSQNHSMLPDQSLKQIQTIVPLSRTGIADVDPFSRWKFGEGPEIQKLLHHCCWITASCMDEEAAGTNFSRVGWLFSKVAWLDPEPNHIMLGYGIHHMARLRGQKEPSIAIKYKTEGMRVINKRLNDPTQALSDGNIGAVASLTSHELLAGTPEDFRIHMNGLDQMINSKGGLIAFSRNRPLQLVVENLDLCRAYIRVGRPTYSKYDEYLTEQLKMTSSLGTSTIQYEVTKMQARNDFCTNFIKMVDGLERATGAIKDASSKTISPEQWNNFSNRIYSAATGTSWLHPTEEIIDERHNLIWQCFRLASLVYLQMALQEFRATPPAHGHHFRACKYRLLDTTTNWGRAIEMLARVILRGERSTVERHRRAWYVANAMIELQDFGLETWQTAAGTLFTYLESVSGKTEGRLSTPPLWR